MLRQVVHRRKGGFPVASLPNNFLIGRQSGTSTVNLHNRVLTRSLHRPKTFEERLETNYYSNIVKENAEINRKIREQPEEYSTVDRLFRYKPLKEDEEDAIDEWEGRPEHVNDEAYKMDTGDPDPRMLLGKSLLQLGKVHYRHADTLPTWFLERQEEISNHRTSPQIRKCLKDWMIKNDRDLLDKYRKKVLKWGHLSTGKGANSLETHTYGPDESIAYAHYFLSSRFALLNRVLGEVKTLHPTFTPKKVLDFGCGPATGGASVRHVFDNTEFKYTGLDISQSMLDAAKIMTEKNVKNSNFYNSSSEVMKHALQTGERYDLIIASHSLNELPNDPSKRIAVQMLFELLDVGGLLVIVENGNPYGSHTVRTARQFVLDTFNHIDHSGRSTSASSSSTFFDKRDATKAVPAEEGEEYDDSKPKKKANQGDPKMFMNKNQASKMDREAKRQAKIQETESYKVVEMMLPPPRTGGYSYEELGAYVVAPCTHDRPCPLANGVWCSFSQKVYSGVIRKANEEKYSYLVMQKRPKNSAYNHVPVAKKGRGSSADSTSTTGTLPKQRGVYGRWLENSPEENSNSSTEQDSPAALLDTVANPTPLSVLHRFMETRNAGEVNQLVDTLIDEVDWEEYNPPLYREEWGRLVRSPIKSKGHITVDVCTPEGQVLRSAMSKGNLVNVPALYTALRKTTWGGLFPVVSGKIERSSLSRNAKGTRYRGGLVVDRDVVVYDKYGNETTSSGSGSGGKKGKRSSTSADSSSTSVDPTEIDYNIPGLPKGMVPTSEMIAVSKSAKYRKLLEAQAEREAEEEEMRESGRGGKGSSGSNVEDSSASSGGGGRRGRGVSAQLERMKARRAAKEQQNSSGTSGDNSVEGEGK